MSLFSIYSKIKQFKYLWFFWMLVMLLALITILSIGSNEFSIRVNNQNAKYKNELVKDLQSIIENERIQIKNINGIIAFIPSVI